MAPPPREGLIGFMRDLLVEVDGVEMRGTRLFAPGAVIYVHPPYSGDGWERTYLTGRSRVDGRLASVLGPRCRVGRAHRSWVTDPDALTLFATSRMGYWEGTSSWVQETLPLFSEDPDAGEREAGWTAGAWDALTRDLLAPERPRLIECLTRVLDVDAAQAEALVAQCAAGRAVKDASQGAEALGGPSLIRRVREAWEALCPEGWTRSEHRRFTGVARDGRGLRELPLSLLGVVSFCALGPVVETAEALARELAFASGASLDARIVWRVEARSAVSEQLRLGSAPRDAPDNAYSLEGWARVMAALPRRIKDNRFDWRAQADAYLRRRATDAELDPLAPLLALTHLGVVVESVTPEQVELLCPTLAVRGSSGKARQSPDE